MLKQLKWGISHQPLIRKHYYLDHRYHGGSAFIPWLLSPGSSFSVMETTYADSWSDMSQLWGMDLWVMKWRSVWPIFHCPVILPYILKTIWCMHIILWEYESVWPYIWPQNYCRSLWPIFHGPVILSYILKTIWCMNIIFFFDYESVWPKVLTSK